MRAISIKEARACLSKLVDLAERGETTVITRSGKQSARVAPCPTRVKRLSSLMEFRSSITPPQSRLSATVLASRREERF